MDSAGWSSATGSSSRCMKKAGEEFTEVPIPIPAGTGDGCRDPLPCLRNLHLVPEDMVSYNAEVFDNDVVSGPKSAHQRNVYAPPSHRWTRWFARRGESSMTRVVDRMTEALRQAEEARKDLDDCPARDATEPAEVGMGRKRRKPRRR